MNSDQTCQAAKQREQENNAFRAWSGPPGVLPGCTRNRLYRSRVEIEYVFRDGKQFLGLQDAQMRTRQAIESHTHCVQFHRIAEKRRNPIASPAARICCFSLCSGFIAQTERLGRNWYHWNMALFVMNLARLEVLRIAKGQEVIVFGLEDMKRRAYNALLAQVLLAQVILANLGLEARFEELNSSPSGLPNFGLKAA